MMAAVSSVNPSPDARVALSELAKAAARRLIVLEARTWLGTPYHHRAALKGVGCDCLGLVRGVWQAVFGLQVPDLPSYTGDWGDVTGIEALFDGLARHLDEVDPSKAQAGDILVFRIRPGRVAKHCGIMTGQARFIHAWESTPVAETTLSLWWERRLVAAFPAPGLTPAALEGSDALEGSAALAGPAALEGPV